MKTALKLFLTAAFLAVFGLQPANAQIGNLLKKAKKVAEAVTGKDVSTNMKGKVAETSIPSGESMQNPLAGVADIELMGAYGRSTSQNYGQVYLVLKVKMLANKGKIGLGGSINNVETIAVDQDGNIYKPYSQGQFPKDVIEGMFVTVTLDESNARFRDVKKTAATFQMIRLGVFVDQQNKGILTFKNVPVQWDVEPQ